MSRDRAGALLAPAAVRCCHTHTYGAPTLNPDLEGKSTVAPDCLDHSRCLTFRNILGLQLRTFALALVTTCVVRDTSTISHTITTASSGARLRIIVPGWKFECEMRRHRIAATCLLGLEHHNYDAFNSPAGQSTDKRALRHPILRLDALRTPWTRGVPTVRLSLSFLR